MSNVTALLIALISMVGTLGAAAIPGYFAIRRKQDQIHVLVNSRLHEALDEIALLKKYIMDSEHIADLPPVTAIHDAPEPPQIAV